MVKIPSVNKEKYENAILFFTKYCNNNYLGATKLNKLLYYLDFTFYRDHGKSVTGDAYVHKDYGPVPSQIDNVVSELHTKGKLGVELVEYGENGMFRYTPLQEPDMSVFSQDETRLLDQICKEFFLWPTDKIVNQTHLEAPWFYSKPYDEVDYKYSKDIDIL